ncbi:hypothetical protein ACLH0K_11535 [Arthrobacter sp. MPF02]|uniref:DUF7847 domain-containing protein n=1 Tax=Arthrobacter sp. MPF02 TaxID=3388492 RepID=UPI003984F8F2
MSPQDSGQQWPGQQWPSQQPWGQGHQQWGQPGWQQQPPGQQPPWGQPSYQARPPYPGSPYQGGPNNPFGQPRYVAPPKPGIVPLRPLMFGEILDGSFQAIRRNAKAMLGAALLAQSLAAILAAVVTAVTATSMGSIEAWADTATAEDVAALGIGFFAAVLVVALLTLFISAVLQGAMVVPVARSILNRPTSFRRMWALSRSRAGALVRLALLLLGAGLLAFVLLAVLGVALVSAMEGTGALLLIPVVLNFIALSIWIAIKVLVAPAAVVVEELGAVAGLRRSWELTRANWWRILGITVVISIMVGIVSQVVMIPVSLLTSFLTTVATPHAGSEQTAAVAVAVGVATAVLGALVGALGYAFQTSVMALLYMDLRMRKDGLDINLLRLLESGADPDGVPGRGAAPGPSGRDGSGPAAGAWPDVR